MAALPAAGGNLLGAQASGDCSPSLPPAATREPLSGAQALNTLLWTVSRLGWLMTQPQRADTLTRVCRCQVEEYHQAVTCLSINRPSPSSIWPTFTFFKNRGMCSLNTSEEFPSVPWSIFLMSIFFFSLTFPFPCRFPPISANRDQWLSMALSWGCNASFPHPGP